MASLEYIPNHDLAALLSLIPPFWGKPRIAALQLGFTGELQILEDAIWSFINGIDVDTCARNELELLAKIVGEPSRPENTEILRLRVKGRILVNKSRGTAADICALVDMIYGTGTLHQARGSVTILTGAFDEVESAAVLLQSAALAGVHARWLTEGTFSFPSDSDSDPPSTQALGTGTWSSSNA